MYNRIICEENRFVRKHWTIIMTVVRHFGQISFRVCNSSLEGARKLKFAPFCSS